MPEPVVPYVGPRPFLRAEGTVFFGREKEIRQVVNLIFANSIVVLYSKSGLGKSSLLNAGVIPRLVFEELEVLAPARIAEQIPAFLQPGAVRNIYMTSALLGWEGSQADLRRLGDLTLTGYLNERAHALTGFGQPCARVILFDQFEELFVRYPDYWEHRADFFKQVQEALDQDPLLRVVFSLREDYLGEMEPYTALLRSRLQARFRLEGLNRTEALEAVAHPLQATGLTLGPGVAKMIVDQLSTIRYPTPDGRYAETLGQFIEPVQLQVVCRSLWERLPAGIKVITPEHLSELSDVGQNLSRLYEDSIRRTVQETGVGEQALREWFASRLITPTRTRGALFRGAHETAGLPNQAVDLLEDLRLIRAEFRAGARWYELAHDALIDPILESNRNWLAR